MRRTPLTTSLFALGLILAGASAAAAASLTRIETRPFYGATVTIEEGVRVFRPLPPHKHIIINPDGKAALNLSFEERNITVHQYVVTEDEPAENAGRFAGGYPARVTGGYKRHRAPNRHMIHVPSAIRAGTPARAQ